jgi:hypothetical protein
MQDSTRKRYVLDQERRPTNPPRWWRPLFYVRDTWTSDRQIVDAFARSGEAWRRMVDLNAGRLVR